MSQKTIILQKRPSTITTAMIDSDEEFVQLIEADDFRNRDRECIVITFEQLERINKLVKCGI